jgi:hypothetical protein
LRYSGVSRRARALQTPSPINTLQTLGSWIGWASAIAAATTFVTIRRIKKALFSFVLLFTIALLMFASVNQTHALVAAAPPKKEPSPEWGTPFQRGIMKVIEALEKNGLPFPRASFNYSSVKDGIYTNTTGITT